MQKEMEEYRQPWESKEHWELRKEFLQAHEGKFPENRLLCLAQAFANVEILGCTYPQAVMKDLNELAKGVRALHVVQEKRKKNSEILFLKGCEDEKCKRRISNQLGTYTKYSSQRPNLPFQNQSYGDYNSPQNYQNYRFDRRGAAAYFNR